LTKSDLKGWLNLEYVQLNCVLVSKNKHSYWEGPKIIRVRITDAQIEESANAMHLTFYEEYITRLINDMMV